MHCFPRYSRSAFVTSLLASLLMVGVTLTGCDSGSSTFLLVELGASSTTSESGGTTTVSVTLSRQPRFDVEVPVTVDDPTEARVSPTSITFTPDNWSIPRTVTVTGEDDGEVDGAQPFHVLVGPSTSSAGSFDGLSASSDELSNQDDDATGIRVSLASDQTTEAGGAVMFSVTLGSMPTADVTLSFSTDDPSEGTLSATSVTFRPTSWNAPRAVVVTGVDDSDLDGDVTYHVDFEAPTSDDPLFAALDAPASLTLVNVDDEVLPSPELSNRTTTDITPDSAHGVSFGGLANGESFQQDAIFTYNGYQYAAFWGENLRMILARRPSGTGPWELAEMASERETIASMYGLQDNSHNSVSIGVSPSDGRLHVVFDQNGDQLNYVRSIAGLLNNPGTMAWEEVSFEDPIHTLSGASVPTVSYPRFVTVPSGELLLVYRTGSAGNGDTVLWEYDAGTWTSLGAFIAPSPATTNAFLHGIEYGGDRLHVTWCWQTSTGRSSNQGLLYAYSDDDGRTWYDSADQLVGTTGSSPITQLTSSVSVWSIPPNRGLLDHEHMFVDTLGRVHVLLSHMPDARADEPSFVSARGKSEYFHYWRDTDGTWTRNAVGIAARGPTFPSDANWRAKLVVSSTHALYVILPGMRIASASPEVDWTNWQLIESEHDGDYYSDPLIDRSQLRVEDVLTIFAPFRIPDQTDLDTPLPIEAVRYDLE